MSLTREAAATIAASYFRTTAPLISLGWGISGYVYLSPDKRAAVKIHRETEPFLQEVAVYRRLRQLRLFRLHGLTIPRYRGHRRKLNAVCMDFVTAPYLLDFAGARFEPPDFTDETLELWHQGLHDMFGPNVSVIYAIYNSLQQHGIYYMDFRPSNVKLDGLPGLLAPNDEENPG